MQIYNFYFYIASDILKKKKKIVKIGSIIVPLPAHDKPRHSARIVGAF